MTGRDSANQDGQDGEFRRVSNERNERIGPPRGDGYVHTPLSRRRGRESGSFRPGDWDYRSIDFTEFFNSGVDQWLLRGAISCYAHWSRLRNRASLCAASIKMANNYSRLECRILVSRFL